MSAPDVPEITLSLPTMIAGVDRDLLHTWCRRIEADGYGAIGFGERIAYRNLEVFTVLATAAAITERVRIEATVVVLPLHSEVLVAKQWATLDVLSGGRTVLGVGVGGRNEDYRAVGATFEGRFGRLDRQVATLRDLWSGVPPEDGLDPVGPRPVQEHVPILSGSMGPKSTARAARWADGVAGFQLDPTTAALGSANDLVLRCWEAEGRDTRPFLGTSFWFALGADAQTRLRAYARGYLGVFGSGIADAMAEMCTVAGADALKRSLEACAECGVDSVQLVPTTTDPAELDRLAEVLEGLY